MKADKALKAAPEEWGIRIWNADLDMLKLVVREPKRVRPTANWRRTLSRCSVTRHIPARVDAGQELSQLRVRCSCQLQIHSSAFPPSFQLENAGAHKWRQRGETS